MTRVFLLRHAETANPNVFHGAESDVELSEHGRHQALAAAKFLAAHRPDVIVSSAMRRARETAEPIAQACGIDVRIERQLHERRVGQLSGMPFDAHDNLWSRTVERWVGGETGFAPDRAESFEAIRERVVPVWERLTADHDGQTLVIVAHGIVCRVLLLSVLPEYSIRDWSRIATPNVGISQLERKDSSWRAHTLSRQPEGQLE